MAAGGSSAQVGTAYEQLIGKLMDGEGGDPGRVRAAVTVWGAGWWLIGQEPSKCTAVPQSYGKHIKTKGESPPHTAGPLSVLR